VKAPPREDAGSRNANSAAPLSKRGEPLFLTTLVGACAITRRVVRIYRLLPTDRIEKARFGDFYDGMLVATEEMSLKVSGLAAPAKLAGRYNR